MFHYGKLTDFSVSDNTVSLHFAHFDGEVTVLTPEIFNIFAAHHTKEHFSKAIEGDKGTGCPFTAERLTDGGVSVRTDRLEARIYDDFKVDFYRADGTLLCADCRDEKKDGGKKLTAEETAQLLSEGHQIVDGEDLGDGGIEVMKQLDGDEAFYGLGDKTGFLNKRSYEYDMWNTDNPRTHTEAWRALYKTIPFFITLKKDAVFGIFFDNTFKSTFNMAKENGDRYGFTAKNGNLDYYFLGGDTMPAVVKNYTYLTGTTPLPQLWTLGYQQSRYGYDPDSDFLEVAEKLRKNRIPCDVLHFDIHYMEGYRVFTWSKTAHPDPKKLLDTLSADGFKAVTIVDPGVKMERGYRIYDEGLEKNYFAKDHESGNVCINRVWPGKTAYPDFGKPALRKWWGENHKALTDVGVAGIWNDMNEPASFDGELPQDVEFTDENRPVSHAEAHNFYGHNMSKATYEGMKALTGKRPFVITRACYAGTQKYSTVWTGDNQSLWAHLQMAIPQLCNLGLSGIAFAGTDVGGFGCNTTPELLTRWTQVGAFSPLFRNHSSLGTLRQEPYVFGDPYMSICREYIALRYSLLPYFYDCFKTCEETGLPVMRPLVLQYENDENVRDMNDQFMIGDDILVSPVVTQGATKKLVYLPAGDWFDFHTGEKLAGGRYIVRDAPLSVCPIFVRDGAILPRFAPQQFVGEIDNDRTLYLTVYGENGSYVHYQDNGADFAYRDGAYNTYEIVNKDGKVETTLLHAGYDKVYETIEVETVR